MVFDIRQGVMWTGNAHIGMEPRELTAEDVAFCWNNWWQSPIGIGFYPFMKRVYAEGNTVVFETEDFDYCWYFWVGDGAGGTGIVPHEVLEAGYDDWRNQCGTGPFILTDYVMGSYVSYVPNPNYWDKAIINGKEYTIPFVDKLVLPIIPDQSTQIAALRTGKVDGSEFVSLRYKDTLAETSPELITTQYCSSYRSLALQCKPGSGKFENKNIRRALMIGTDLEAIAKAVYVEAELHVIWWYGMPALWTPIEELPPETKILFSNDPDLARQMLADEGYPDGFDMELVINAAAQDELDFGAMLVDQWDRFGVNLSLKAVEPTILEQLRYSRAFTGALSRGWGKNVRGLSDWLSDSLQNASGIQDADYDTQYLKAAATVDRVERNALLKDLAIHYLDTVSVIPMPAPYSQTYRWPWLKNWYGERNVGFVNMGPMYARMWIDQDLKAEMGY